MKTQSETKYPHPTTRDTAELLALKSRIEKLSPPDRLRLAAELIEAGKLPLAESVAAAVVGELQALRILGKLHV